MESYKELEALLEETDAMDEVLAEERYESTLIDFNTQIGSDPKIATSSFVKESFKAVMDLHQQILTAKEETLEQLKAENSFLKESLSVVQEVYDQDRETIKLLSSQIDSLQQELEFTKRKYKLMWNKAVENYQK
ncbi:MAG: DUF3972 domain-containing protein [Epsilonproteobacteria bacterium]|nr:DUF3972 domain-containing protein [Campylobacterota bacterium]